MSGELSAESVATGSGADDRSEWVEFVHFHLGDGAYELELGRVKQIVRNPEVTQVPQSGAAIAGVTNLGGEIAVAIDGRALFGLPDRPSDADAILLLLDRGNAQPTGFLVDAVPGIDPHHVDAIATPTEVEWEPPVDDGWFRAVVEETERTGGPVGVVDFEAVVEEAREQS